MSNNLVFTDFKNAAPIGDNGSPRVKDMVGKNYVLHLITDGIYIDLKMLSWRSGGNGGGFSYERSTNQNLSIHSNNNSPILMANYVNHQLELENTKNYSKYKIVDISFKTIVSSKFNGSNFIIINNLKPGLYFLIIDDKTSTKFVKY